MKNFIFGVFFFLFAFSTDVVFTQDIITLKNGDEIKSKVIEVTPDLVKYKKWENQDGPMYSSNKLEVFMIKYANGTKDVFKDTPAPVTNSAQTINGNNGIKFIGTWYHKKYNGKSNKTILNISRAGEDYLVDSKVHTDDDGLFFVQDGSFKEVGHLEGSSIVINSFIKVSLIDENTILMNSEEYYKSPNNRQAIIQAASNGGNNIENVPKHNEGTESLTATIESTIPVLDVEGNVYKAVAIGNQVWMAENLKTTKYNNGTNIPYISSDSEWKYLKTPGYCWPLNDSTKKSIYGALYNWHTVNTRILCPTGWHIPTDADWTSLTNNNGDKIFADSELGGFRSNSGVYGSTSKIGVWWSCTKNDSGDAWVRFLNFGYSVLGRHGKYYLESGFSVRCIKD